MLHLFGIIRFDISDLAKLGIIINAWECLVVIGIQSLLDDIKVVVQSVANLASRLESD